MLGRGPGPTEGPLTGMRSPEGGLKGGMGLGGRPWRTAAALFLAALAVLIPGCRGRGDGAADTGISVEKGTEGSGGGAVVLRGEGEESRVEVWEFEPDEDTLGLPLYPGAELVPGSALVSRITRGEKVLLSHQAEYVTSDDLRAVVRWYRGKVGEPLESGEGEATWALGEEDGGLKSVKVEGTEGGTRIRIIRLSGDLDLRLEGEPPR